MSVALQPAFPPYASIAATRIDRSHTLRSAAAAEYDVSALHGAGIAKPVPLLRAVTLPIPRSTVRDPAPASSPPHDADSSGAPYSQQGPATTETSKCSGGGSTGGGGSSTKATATRRPSTESKPSKPPVTLTAGPRNVPPVPPPLRRSERSGAASGGAGGGGKGSAMLSHRGVSEPAASYRGVSTPPSAASYRGASTPPARAGQGRAHLAARQRAVRRLSHD